MQAIKSLLTSTLRVSSQSRNCLEHGSSGWGVMNKSHCHFFLSITDRYFIDMHKIVLNIISIPKTIFKASSLG